MPWGAALNLETSKIGLEWHRLHISLTAHKQASRSLSLSYQKKAWQPSFHLVQQRLQICTLFSSEIIFYSQLSQVYCSAKSSFCMEKAKIIRLVLCGSLLLCHVSFTHLLLSFSLERQIEWSMYFYEQYKHLPSTMVRCNFEQWSRIYTVRDVIWMSANGLHLCKWTVALIQVTLSHLNRCPNELTTWSSALQHLEVLAGLPNFWFLGMALGWVALIGTQASDLLYWK